MKLILSLRHSVVPFPWAILRFYSLFQRRCSSRLRLSEMISLNWNFDKIFLFCTQFGYSSIGNARQRIRCGWEVIIFPTWVGLSSQDALGYSLTLAKHQRNPQTHRHMKETKKRRQHRPKPRLRRITEHTFPAEFLTHRHFSSLSLVPFLLQTTSFLVSSLIRFTFYKVECHLPRLQTAYAALSGL